MEELAIHLGYAKILGGVSLISIFLTTVIYLVFKGNRYMKYLPGIILLIIGLYNLYSLVTSSDYSDGVTRLLMATMGIVTGIVGLSTGLIIGVYIKGRED